MVTFRALVFIVAVVLIAACPLPVYRLHNPGNGKYTLAIGPDVAKLEESGWKSEGIVFYAYPEYSSGLVPVFHLYNRLTGDHFFTADPRERNSVLYSSGAWTYWGVAFFAYPADREERGLVNVYRFWMKDIAGHLYTSSKAEANVLKFEGNIFEGTAFKVLPAWGSYKMLGVIMKRAQDVPLQRNIEDFNWTVKAHHQIVGISVGWEETILPEIKSLLLQVSNTQAYPLIFWNPWEVSLEEIKHGFYDCYIKDFANMLKGLESPILLAFAPCPNTPESPWFSLDNPENFIEAFRRIKSIFFREGANNVYFVWMVEASDEDPEPLYPDDGSVDIIGLRKFSLTEPYDTYYSILRGNILREVEHHPEKPILVEVARATSGNPAGKAEFIKELYRQLAREPQIFAVVYYNDFLGYEPRFPDFRVTRTYYWKTVPIDPVIVDGYSFAVSFFTSP